MNVSKLTMYDMWRLSKTVSSEQLAVVMFCLAAKRIMKDNASIFLFRQPERNIEALSNHIRQAVGLT